MARLCLICDNGVFTSMQVVRTLVLAAEDSSSCAWGGNTCASAVRDDVEVFFGAPWSSFWGALAYSIEIAMGLMEAILGT